MELNEDNISKVIKDNLGEHLEVVSTALQNTFGVSSENVNIEQSSSDTLTVSIKSGNVTYNTVVNAVAV